MVRGGEGGVEIEDPEQHDQGVYGEEQDQVTPVQGCEHSQTQHPVGHQKHLVDGYQC